MNTPKLLSILCAVALLSFGPQSNAATATVFNSVTVSAGANSPDADDVDFGSGPVSASLTSSFGTSNFVGSAESTSTFGSVRSKVSVDITDYAAESYTTTGPICGGSTFCAPGGGPITDPVSAFTQIIDTLTVIDPTQTGMTGYMDLTFDVTGTTTLTNSPNLDFNAPSAQGSLSVRADSMFVKSWGFTGDTTLVSPLFEFTYGTPFDLRLDSTFFVFPTDAISPTLMAGDTWDLSATVDFMNTIELMQVGIYDNAAGTQLASGFDLNAESGTMYSTSVVPLPAAVWLFISALVAIGGLASRRTAH